MCRNAPFLVLLVLVLGCGDDSTGPSNGGAPFDAFPPSEFLPAWSGVEPQREIVLEYDTNLTFEANGERLRDALAALQPGDHLRANALSTQVWTVTTPLRIDVTATADAPVKVTVLGIVDRPNALQNGLDVGQVQPTSFVHIEGMNLRGGATGIRLHRASDVLISECRVTDSADAAIAATSEPTARVWLFGNVVTDQVDGDGIMGGSGFGTVQADDWTLYDNQVFGLDGVTSRGIVLNLGPGGARVVRNTLNDNEGEGIVVVADPAADVVVDANMMLRNGGAGLRVLARGTVRNNVVVSADGPALVATSYSWEGTTTLLPTALRIYNNTFAAGSDATVRLGDWSDDPARDLRFHNNAVAHANGVAMNVLPPVPGDFAVGNVVYGTVNGLTRGFTVGAGTADYRGLSFDFLLTDVRPAADGALVDAATEGDVSPHDHEGLEREGIADVGALELR